MKVLIPLYEKNIPFESAYTDLHKTEQDDPWFPGINPKELMPVLDHDGFIINHSTVIDEYVEDALPGPPRARRIYANACACATGKPNPESEVFSGEAGAREIKNSKS